MNLLYLVKVDTIEDFFVVKEHNIMYYNDQRTYCVESYRQEIYSNNAKEEGDREEVLSLLSAPATQMF